MQTLIFGLRQILGTPDFYDAISGSVDYDLMLEYVFAGLILLVVVGSVFRILSWRLK